MECAASRIDRRRSGRHVVRNSSIRNITEEVQTMGTETKRPLAVVTGAASGIGFELARLCIANDFDVVICADDARRIQEAAARLGANVIPITADLATTEGVEKLARE